MKPTGKFALNYEFTKIACQIVHILPLENLSVLSYQVLIMEINDVLYLRNIMGRLISKIISITWRILLSADKLRIKVFVYWFMQLTIRN